LFDLVWMNPTKSQPTAEEEPTETEEDATLDPAEIVEIVPISSAESKDEPSDEDAEEEDAKLPQELVEALEVLANDDSIQGFFDHTESVFSIALHPSDDRVAVTGGGDDLSYVWDITTGEATAKLVGHTDSIIDAAFSFDGKYVATASMDGTVRVYSSANYSLHKTLEGPAKELEWFMWHPRGHVLAAGSADNTIWVWNVAVGEVMQVLAGHLGPVLCGTWSTDGKKLCTGSEDGSLFVWDVKNGKPFHHVKGYNFHEGPVTCIAGHPDSGQSIVATGSLDASVKLVNTDTGKVLSSFKGHTESVETIGFCRSLPWLATGSVDHAVHVWDINTSQSRLSLPHDEVITKLLWHPTEPLLYSASMDKLVRLFDARSGECVAKFSGHQDSVLDFTVSRDGQTVVSASDDHTCLVFRRGATKRTAVVQM